MRLDLATLFLCGFAAVGHFGFFPFGHVVAILAENEYSWEH